jgi:hypothetical protein
MDGDGDGDARSIGESSLVSPYIARSSAEPASRV